MTTRQRKTPAERAQETFEVAQRTVTRLVARRLDHVEALTSLDVEIADATRRRDYLAANPDLPPQDGA